MIPLLGYNSNHCGGSMVLYQYVSNRSLYITLNTLNLPQQLWDLFADQCHFSFQFYHLLPYPWSPSFQKVQILRVKYSPAPLNISPHSKYTLSPRQQPSRYILTPPMYFKTHYLIQKSKHPLNGPHKWRLGVLLIHHYIFSFLAEPTCLIHPLV